MKEQKTRKMRKSGGIRESTISTNSQVKSKLERYNQRKGNEKGWGGAWGRRRQKNINVHTVDKHIGIFIK